MTFSAEPGHSGKEQEPSLSPGTRVKSSHAEGLRLEGPAHTLAAQLCVGHW